MSHPGTYHRIPRQQKTTGNFKKIFTAQSLAKRISAAWLLCIMYVLAPVHLLCALDIYPPDKSADSASVAVTASQCFRICSVYQSRFLSHSCQPSRFGRDSPGMLGLVPVASRFGQNTYDVPDLVRWSSIASFRGR